ncbi:nucleotide-binding universal stress UspA family protein [Nocardiopsis terrae]|uniref:Nucleotide-binding universal stress UspA family protein n=1 Tax=Nocardiopsis terrae TaxID=372655 RepID=A0ABR9HPH9_9ACTN|nr:universal stress protein [Nocardiopsis terrae]MBE1460930.1 nucleotide-binding universal stress UspA family protein [Nocardiopsis terrae]
MNAQERPPAVIVGVDGSPAAHEALVWAAEAAARRREQLRIVHGLGVPTVVGTLPGAGGVERHSAVEAVREAGQALLAESAEYARGARPDLDVATVLGVEDAPEVLLNEAGHGDVIVVGSRGLGAVRAIVLGSVSVRTSAHAPCPVVVVPEPDGRDRHRGKVVVGVDGSDSSRRALRFALDHALVTDSSVVVVNSWEVPLPEDSASLAADAQSLHEEVFDRQSEEIVAGVLAEVVDDRTEALDITAVRMQADPAQALLRAGEDADLIVVGSRGRGGVRGLVLGSTSQGVLHDARGPVAVLPPHSDETDR